MDDKESKPLMQPFQVLEPEKKKETPAYSSAKYEG